MVEAQRSRVGVDVKALVDKVLGRYATDFGTLRELIQNADDAGARDVHFVWDWRTMGTKSLLTEEMAAWQGPRVGT